MQEKTFSLTYGGSFEDLARRIDEWRAANKPTEVDFFCSLIEEDDKLVRLDYTILYE